jgi:hypothetical protein
VDFVPTLLESKTLVSSETFLMTIGFQMRLIRALDFYPKFDEDVRRRTVFGGFLAMSSFVVMIILFEIRFRAFMGTKLVQKFGIDNRPLPFSAGRVVDPDLLPKMSISFDVFLNRMPCAYIHVNVIDTIKEFDNDIQGRVKMERFNNAGRPVPKRKTQEIARPLDYCGSCYSMKSGCCNTCKEVRKAFKAKRKLMPPLATIEQCSGDLDLMQSMENESCRVSGSISVHQFPGTFHIAPGDSYEAGEGQIDSYERIGLDLDSFNVSHEIEHFNIGEPRTSGSFPLDGVRQIQESKGRLKIYYYVRAIPIGGGRYSIDASGYRHYRGNQSTKFPGIFFAYDISPIHVILEDHRNICEFLTEISAILGGVFALTAFLDSLIYQYGWSNRDVLKIQ